VPLKGYSIGGRRSNVLEISVLLEQVDAARLSDKVSENSNSNYSLNVSLSELERATESLVLSFSLELNSQPQAARIKVAGRANLKGSKDEIREAITAAEENKPPQILLSIYERVYSTIYLLSESLKVPHPLPNLLKKAP
jgi:ribosomal 50S subunit-associated protein YjgA (DUF615 family)